MGLHGARIGAVGHAMHAEVARSIQTGGADLRVNALLGTVQQLLQIVDSQAWALALSVGTKGRLEGLHRQQIGANLRGMRLTLRRQPSMV
jgi:hypothetical protein